MILRSLKSTLLFMGLLACVFLLMPRLNAQTTQDAVSGNVVAAPLVVEHVDDAQLTTLKGNTRPEARAKYDQGRVSPDLPMGDLVLVLRRGPEQQAAFDAYVKGQYDANSPLYHQWLTPEQVGEKFGPAQADIDSATNWLKNHGFSIDNLAKNHLAIRFSGTSGQVEEAFHVEVHNLKVPNSEGKIENHIANMSDPQIPAALAPVVVGVKALHNFFPRPQYKLGGLAHKDAGTGLWRRQPADALTVEKKTGLGSQAATVKPLFGINDPNNGYLVEDVTPYDFAAIYNVKPLWSASSPIDGTGQTIAIAGTSNIELSDVATFRSSFGLPANVPTVIVTNSDPGSTSAALVGDRTENTLDVEWSGSVAKGAKIILVTSSAPTSSTDPLYLSEDYIVQHKTASIMNVSYGECELGMGTAGNAQYNTLWQTAASEGIAVFVSTGDSGSPSCDQGGDAGGTPYAAQYGVSVSGLASTPYNTAVGGTDFNWGSTASPYWNASNSSSNLSSAAGYIPEVPWNSTCTNPLSLTSIQGDANQIGVSGVSDAESACNFIWDYASYIYQNYTVDLSFFVDTVGGSGGKSACTTSDGSTVSSCSGGYAKPSWQTGVTGIPADSKRDIPDISFFASNGFLGSAYLICDTLASDGGTGTVTIPCTYSAATEDVYQEVGGTSVSSPAMAGVMALINQKAGGPQGSPNTELYKLAAKQSYASCSSETVKASSTSCVFNDVDTGTNSMACLAGSPNCTLNNSSDSLGLLSGYAATKGYDLATGLGSANVANLVNGFSGTVVTAPKVTLSFSTFAFANTNVGVLSVGKTVSLTNSGNAVLSISSIAIGGTNASSFTVEATTCGTTLAAGSVCYTTVGFRPTTAGALTGELEFTDNAGGSPQLVHFSGTGVVPPAPVVAVSANSLVFGSSEVGTALAGIPMRLSNTGNATLSISLVAITGTNATSFNISGKTCGTTLAAGAYCYITVGFKPAVSGALTASLQISDNAKGSPQTIHLSGTGLAPVAKLSASTFTFAAGKVGVAEAGKTMSLSNTGNAALTISSMTLTGTNATSFSIHTNCAASLATGAVCYITIYFKPTVTGALTAKFNLTDNAVGSPQSVSITGTGD